VHDEVLPPAGRPERPLLSALGVRPGRNDRPPGIIAGLESLGRYAPPQRAQTPRHRPRRSPAAPLVAPAD